MDCQNLKCGSISSKNILIFPYDFLNFRFDAIQFQGTVNLSCYESRGYASVILDHHKVTFLGKREDATFCSSVYYVLVIYGIAVSKQYVVKFSCSLHFCGFSSRPAVFQFLIFVCTSSSSSWVKCPRFICHFVGFPKQVLEILFPRVYSIFLAGSF